MAYPNEEDKTMVFSFGSLACEGAPSAREYTIYEAPGKSENTARGRADILLIVTALLAAALSVLLLVAALMGQARLTELNDQAVMTGKEIGELRREQTELRIRYEETFDLEEIEEYATVTLGMQKPGNEQIDYADPVVPDQVTVLAKENGLDLSVYCRAVIDSLGACFH